MAILFSKTYSGKIKRTISEGLISPSALPEVYLKKQKEVKIETDLVESRYPARIFNIVPKQKSVEITTNTLGISLTNIINPAGKAYFKFIASHVKDKRVLIDLDTYEINGMVYVNTDLDYIKDGDNLILIKDIFSLNLWDRSPDISIRRLKDRFKITVKTSQPNELTINLKVKSIFTPSIRNNWMSFYDCVYNTNDNTASYLYTHSFEYYDKVEIHEKTESILLRDQPISDILVEEINNTYNKVSYKTYRSNLYINLELVDNDKVYLDFLDNQSNIYLTNSTSLVEGVTELFTIKKQPTVLEDIRINPYIGTNLYKGRPEQLFFVWETDSKYARHLNVPIGCERIELDLTEAIKRELKTFKTTGELIKENNIPVTNRVINVTNYIGKTDLNGLLEKIGIGQGI